MVKISAYQPFKTAEEALENITTIAQNKVPKTLKNFLTAHLPATKSAKKKPMNSALLWEIGQIL